MPLEEKRRVHVYAADTGKQPFNDWVESLPLKTQLIVDQNIAKLESPSFTNFKRVGSVFELRIHIEGGYRIYFGQDGSDIILLLTGGKKDTQGRDIRKAEQLWQDYLKRKK